MTGTLKVVAVWRVLASFLFGTFSTPRVLCLVERSETSAAYVLYAVVLCVFDRAESYTLWKPSCFDVVSSSSNCTLLHYIDLHLVALLSVVH